MPQRTRKEKQDASKRRQYRILMHEHTVKTVPHKEVQHQKEPVETEAHPIKTYLLSDLRKSLFIIVAIFALEILLYFVSIGYQS